MPEFIEQSFLFPLLLVLLNICSILVYGGENPLSEHCLSKYCFHFMPRYLKALLLELLPVYY